MPFENGDGSVEAGPVNTVRKMSPVEVIRDNLLDLNYASRDVYRSRSEAEKDLEEIENGLENLQSETDGFEVLTLHRMYIDLRADFESERDLRLDSSFDALVDAMQEEIKTAGVHKESPDETVAQDVVRSLRDAGVSPEYVVTTGNPNAPTVVLFMQAHPNPGMTPEMMEDLGINASQGRIVRDISAIVESRMPLGTVYYEGLPAQDELSGTEAAELDSTLAGSSLAGGLLKKKFDNRIHIEGIENMQLLSAIVDGLIRGESKAMQYRTTAHNVLLASNIIEDINADDSTPGTHVLVLGGAHEKALFGKASDDSLPISQVLAYYGVNVVVVDAATTYLDMTKLQKHAEALIDGFDSEISSMMSSRIKDVEDAMAATSMRNFPMAKAIVAITVAEKSLDDIDD